ncbi:hypothetical protein ABT390_33875 [Streptomyces aurantiacus]|uniref:Uncharacterized protein n=1 Tax=Streptomyces aurantiacus JA 4570 TaxID=1286094 RepID=S3ZUM1_9ACTN|nr:hypothetical protein [Streptomyces aurantiacus]EPH46893.1 hypothetical protein STRAU_0059 [Streptomyces aurantiacus JA 4570]
MSFLPRTVYAVSCDSCGATYHAQDQDDLGSDYELTLESAQLDAGTARCMTTEGWIITTRHLCPVCVQARSDAVTERLETELTHTPLFEFPIHRPAPPEGTDPA